MKLLHSQENAYGVSPLENQFCSDANKVNMASTNNIETQNENSMEEGSVVSNLPLLFANGYPTSLERITMVQLERFITFMVQCSLGHDDNKQIVEPQWWPKEVKFSNPLTRPKKMTDNWMANLKKLVFRCYTYHRSEYLLRFCSYLARYPREELEYVNNWDSTTSLYHKSTGKLLVTFRNENMNYDMRNESPRKKLLAHNGAASGYLHKSKQQPQSLIMVEPPTEDIYLCDNCDAEFIGLQKMKEHETTCERDQSNGPRPDTPDVSVTKPLVKQDQFLEYFHLRSSNAEGLPITANKGIAPADDVVRRGARRVRGSINFTRCSNIPFSSPAGLMLAKKTKAMTEETQQERLERIERHILAPALTNSEKPKWWDGEAERGRWVVTYKPGRDKLADNYIHQYRFVNSVKRKPTLSIQSQLLYIVCRPIYVLLTRLTQEQIDELKRDASKYRCPIRKISVNKKAPSRLVKLVKERQTGLPSKRKAPEEEGDTIVKEEPEICNVLTNTTALTGYKSCKNDSRLRTEQISSPATIRLKSPHAITVIDLCSSDEEDLSVPATSDENRDPRNSTETGIHKSLVRKLTPSKLCTKPCIYPANSTNEWLSDNIFNDTGENCTSKYRSSVMLNACTNLSPILRPTT